MRSAIRTRCLTTLLLLLAPLATACRRGERKSEERPPATAAARRPPGPGADTVLARPRGAVWSAALHAFRAAHYELGWFDAAHGTAEFAREPGIWLQLAVPPHDTGGTAVVVGAARSPILGAGPASARSRAPGAAPPRVPDDTLAARARAMLASIVATSAQAPDADLLADSGRTPIDSSRALACRGARLGEGWVEVDYRTDGGRCRTSTLFGLAPNVVVAQRIDRHANTALVEACRSRNPLPRGWSIAYSYPDPRRCQGAGANSAEGNIVVLERQY